jgi:hypothetical protein
LRQRRCGTTARRRPTCCDGTAFGDALAEQLDCWRQADEALIDGAAEDSEWPLRVADDYLMPHASVSSGCCRRRQRIGRACAEPKPRCPSSADGGDERAPHCRIRAQ